MSFDYLESRFLEDVTDERAVSNCFCPIGAVIEDRVPPPAELQNRFVGTLAEQGVGLNLRELEEVDVAACDEELRPFGTSLRYEVVLDSRTRREEAVAVSRFLRDAYNNLAAQYCDPLERRIDRLTVGEFRAEGAEPGCTRFVVSFRVEGSCRGCEDGTSLFSSGSAQGRRHLSRVEEHALNLLGHTYSPIKCRRQPVRLQPDDGCK